MFARMFTIEGRREQVDEFSRVGEEKVLPALQRFDGFEGLLVLANHPCYLDILVLHALANHQNGNILVVTLWEREEAMLGGEEASCWFRAFSADTAGGDVTTVERYEVVYSQNGEAQH